MQTNKKSEKLNGICMKLVKTKKGILEVINEDRSSVAYIKIVECLKREKVRVKLTLLFI